MAVDLSVFSRLKGKAAFDREAEEFALRKQKALQSARGQDPAPLKLANEYQARINAGDIDGANLIMQFAKTQDRGLAVDANGNFVPLPNYADAVGSIAGAKAMYTQNAQNQSDLAYKPMIARDVAQQQANVEMGSAPQIEAAKKAAVLESEYKTQAGLDNPKKQAQSQQMLDLLDSIEQDKGLSAVVGMPNPLQGRIPFIGNVVGTPAADFQAKLDQLGGKQFLEAFESLKGGGQITQIEGEKATNAIASMQTAQSEEAFKKSLNDFRAIVQNAANRANQAAGESVNLGGQEIPLLAVDANGDPMVRSQNAIIQRNQELGANPYGNTNADTAAEAETIFNAKKAIQKGKDPAAVRQRLLDNGIDPAKAGL